MTDHPLLAPLLRIHQAVRDRVVARACQSDRDLSAVARDEEGDTIYEVDRISEDALLELVEREIISAGLGPVVLVAEGISTGAVVLPTGAAESSAKWRIIADPVDGTRGYMFQKRPAWILTGVAPNRGPDTRLTDIELAVMTEIPLGKQHLSDTLWAERGKGYNAVRHNRITGETRPVQLGPSGSGTLSHGFATLVRFFPGASEETGRLYDALAAKLIGPPERGKARCFEDQYISSGGQLYELIAGHDRFVADLRPVIGKMLAAHGRDTGICCHPYDMCTELIAREAGVIVCDEHGTPLSNRLCLDEDVAWLGFANRKLYDNIMPVLRELLANLK